MNNLNNDIPTIVTINLVNPTQIAHAIVLIGYVSVPVVKGVFPNLCEK